MAIKIHCISMSLPNLIKRLSIKCLSYLPQSFLDKAEGYIAQLQGKGWGNSTLKHELKLCESFFKIPPTTLIDVGARFGDYAANFLDFPARSRIVYLFEPSKSCYNDLVIRFSKLPNVHIINCALSDENTTSTLYYPYSGSGFSSLNKRIMGHHDLTFSESEDITCITFRKFFEDSNLCLPIDLVKIDVEGYELKVLKGFYELLAEVKLIQFEFGSAHIDSRVYFQDLWYFFKERGFILFRITPSGPYHLTQYKERYECFSTTNYIALNMRFSQDFNFKTFTHATI